MEEKKASFIKKLTVTCEVEGGEQSFSFYLGKPCKGSHPLENQADWISRERSGSIPQGVMDAVKNLYEVAEANGATFDEVCRELKSESENEVADESDYDDDFDDDDEFDDDEFDDEEFDDDDDDDFDDDDFDDDDFDDEEFDDDGFDEGDEFDDDER